MSTVNDLLIKLIKLRGPCPEICDGTFQLGGPQGTGTIDIHTGLPVITGNTCDCGGGELVVPSGSMVLRTQLSSFIIGDPIDPINSLSWFPTTGDFTFEFFLRQDYSVSGYPESIIYYTDIGIIPATLCSYISPYANSYRVGWPFQVSDDISLPNNYSGQWLHLSFSRESGTIRLHVNGEMKYKLTGNTDNMFLSVLTGYPLRFGISSLLLPYINPNYIWYGQISNIRWTNSAVYTGDTSFSVPTEPLTILPETKLLMLARSNSLLLKDETGLTPTFNEGSFWSPESPFS